MAENRGAKKGSGGQFTWLFMTLALVLVVGFMVWLAVASEPSTVPVVEAEEDVPSAMESSAATQETASDTN